MTKKVPMPVVILTVLAAGALLAFLMYTPKPEAAPDSLPPENAQKNVDALAVPGAAIAEQDGVAYYGDVKGFYAAPKAPGTYPGVVMVHEWWGLNDQIKQMARQLAAQGYQVLAVDLYHGSVATTAPEAQALVGKANQKDMTANMEAAVGYLRRKGALRLASLGWCFGGGQSLQLALSGTQLDATVLYYGTPLVTDAARLKAISWPVLGIFGDKDQAIPLDQMKKFDIALTTDGIAHEVHIYPGVGHAFANPSGANYAPAETKDAWTKTLAFLKTNLQ